MNKKISESLKGINYKLLISLIVMGLVPAIYTTVRTSFLGMLPDEYAFSIAGQLNWIELFYEVLDEAIILPLFYFMGKELTDKHAFTNKIKTGLLLSSSVYLFLSLFLMISADSLLKFMATSPEIIKESSVFIRLESIANIAGICYRFMFVCLVTVGLRKAVYVLTGVRLVLSLLFDTFFISGFKFSLKLGVNGIAVSNIVVNLMMFILIAAVLFKKKYNIFKREKLDFKWCKDFLKVGGLSGLESLVRNLFYMLMICRMVNAVGEQGTYWVANSFIWCWLLLPVLQLGELIKQEVATDKRHLKNNLLGYFVLTLIFTGIWFILIPAYKPFMEHVLNFADVDKLFGLVVLLLGFYVLFAMQNIWDSIFYGLGKTDYMLAESIVTNVVYYGIAFALYAAGKFTPSLNSVALMFGLGIAFDAVVSFVAFVVLIKKEKQEIWNNSCS